MPRGRSTLPPHPSSQSPSTRVFGLPRPTKYHVSTHGDEKGREGVGGGRLRLDREQGVRREVYSYRLLPTTDWVSGVLPVPFKDSSSVSPTFQECRRSGLLFLVLLRDFPR